MINTEITFFSHWNSPDKPHYLLVSDALERIRTGSAVKDRIMQIRQETDKDKRKKIKDDLPCICFAGKFNKRQDDQQLTHSGLAIFDFDHVDVVTVKSQLMLLPFVFAVFISPSGDGVKALVRIPPVINEHRQYYLSVVDELKKIAAVDTTSKNPSRICFESYDSEIYINPQAIEWTKKIELVTTPATVIITRQAIETDYSKVMGPINMIRHAPDGEKHPILLKASKLMGGLVAGGYVEESEGERLLQQEILRRDILDEAGAKKTIRDGMEYGMRLPIYDDNKPHTSFINPVDFKASLKGYDKNNLITFLNNRFGSEITGSLISKYFIGTSKHWTGANIFWQIDMHGKIRAGKIMLYDPETGKRINDHIAWTHNVGNMPELNLRQCFFGSHLLADHTKPIALCKSESTAIIGSIYFPDFIWIASGHSAELTSSMVHCLKGRKVILFPNVKTYDQWNKIDVVDFVDHKDFIQPIQVAAVHQERIRPADSQSLIPLRYRVQSQNQPEAEISAPAESWSEQIAKIETWFKTASLPSSVKLNSYTTVSDPQKYYKSHLNIVKGQNGKARYRPYLERLQALQSHLS